jgi:hypothetical protein
MMERKRLNGWIIAFYAVILIGTTMSAIGVKQGLDRRAGLAEAGVPIIETVNVN